MKTHIKRSLSLFLSLVMIITSLGVAFQAWADDIQDARDENVTSVETLIKDFYDNHRNSIYSTKDEDAKNAAVAKYEETSKALSALSSSEKLQLNKAYYGYWLYTVSTYVVRSVTNKTPTQDEKNALASTRLNEVEAVCGELPKEYKEVLTKFEPLTRKSGSSYVINSKTNYKNNSDAQQALSDLIDNVKSFTLEQLEFSDYVTIYSSGGYYFNQTNLSEKTGASTINSIAVDLYYENQDLNADGGDPTAFSKATYLSRTGKAPNYVYAWKTGKNAQMYIDDFDKYVKSYQSNVIEQGEATVNQVLAITDSFSFSKDLSAAVNAVKKAGLKSIKNESLTVDEVKNAVSLVDNLSPYSKKVWASIKGTSYSKVYCATTNVYTNADELTAEIAYTNDSKLTNYNLDNCLSQLNNKIYDMMLDDFNDYIANVDLTKVTDSIVTAAKQKYVDLPSNYRSKITSDTLSKFMQIVMPEPDHNDFSQEIKDYKITDIVRPANSDIAWTEGGIQSSADGLYNLICNVTNLIAPNLKIKDTGFDTVLKENVYTNQMVSNIIDLYATLSRNDLDLGVMNFTLGKVINMICSPSEIENALEEAKYKTAVDKMKEHMSKFDKNGEKNQLEYLADLTFKSGDFGFEDGDRAGFVDALLAILRPITNLLAPGSKAMGLVSLEINMFDYLDGNGNYVNGVYSNLIPALEAMGLTSIPTAQEYKANYYNVVDKSGTNIAADEFLRPLLDAVCTQYIDVVSPDAVNGLIKLLPGIAYTIGSNLLNDSVKSALAQAGMLSGLASSLDLSGDSINKMITAQPIVINGNPIQLQAVDWLTLGNCATVSSVKSKSNGNDYLMLRTGDTDTCFTTVYYYVYDVLFADENNLESLQKIIDTSITNSAAAIMVNRVINSVAYREKEDSYAKFLYVVGGKPTGAEIPGRPTTPQEPTTEPTTEPTKPSEPATEPTQPSQPATQPTAPVTQPSAPAITESNKTKLPKNYKKVGKDIVNTKQKKASFKKVKAQKKAIAFEWKKVSGIKGYQIQYTTDKKFKKGVKSTTITKQKTTKKTVKKLKGKKKYYVRIRTYKTQKINGKTVKVYSNWSKTKSVKTKK